MNNPSSAAIYIENLYAAYGKRQALKNVTCAIQFGETIALIGANGAGKTSFLLTAAGLLRPKSGTVLLKNKSVSLYKDKERAEIIGFIPQKTSFAWPISVFDAVCMGRFPKTGALGRLCAADYSAANTAIENFDLQPLRDRLTNELSGGEFQRVLLARALCREPEILLLDEPFFSLDPGGQKNLLKYISKIAQNGATIIVSAHDLNCAAAFARRIIAFRNGSILADGLPRDVLTKKTLKSIYNEDFIVRRGGNEEVPLILPY